MKTPIMELEKGVVSVIAHQKLLTLHNQLVYEYFLC